jgi:hypothetical protein
MRNVSSTVRLAFVSMSLLALPAVARPSHIGSNRDDECVQQPPAQPPQAGADVAWLRAIAWAFEPAPVEVRAQAVEDLGLLGDPRSLNPLAQLCLDPNPVLARAAVRAIALLRHPRSEEILVNVVKHAGLNEQVRTRALELLPYQNTWSALRFIHLTASQPNPSAAVGLLAAKLAQDLPRPPGWVPPAPPAPVTRGSR